MGGRAGGTSRRLVLLRQRHKGAWKGRSQTALSEDAIKKPLRETRLPPPLVRPRPPLHRVDVPKNSPVRRIDLELASRLMRDRAEVTEKAGLRAVADRRVQFGARPDRVDEVLHVEQRER